jgi:hypothetical protein
MGRSGCEQVSHTNVVFVSTEVDKRTQPAGLSRIGRKNLSPKLRCVGRAHTTERTNAHFISSGRIAVAMFPSGRDERWVSAFPMFNGDRLAFVKGYRLKKDQPTLPGLDFDPPAATEQQTA